MRLLKWQNALENTINREVKEMPESNSPTAGYDTYMGVKMISAKSEEKDGKPGYAVIYPDGYVSWSPKEAFEKSYLKLDDQDGISQQDVERMIVDFDDSKPDQLTVLSGVECCNGWRSYETTSYTEERLFNEQSGIAVNKEKLYEKIRKNLIFVFMWAKNGIVVK